jgi:hypothetical protein
LKGQNFLKTNLLNIKINKMKTKNFFTTAGLITSFTLLILNNANSQVVLNYGAQISSTANDVAIDRAGNIFVTGHDVSWSTIYPEEWFFSLETIKYPSNVISGSGPDWVNLYPAPPGGQSPGKKIATDLDGNVYVMGYYHSATQTIRYNPVSGTEDWRKLYAAVPNGLAVDNVNHYVYVAGNSYTYIYPDLIFQFAIVRYNMSDGTFVVDILKDANNNAYYGEAEDVAIDELGYVYVTGYINLSNGTDYATVKYDIPTTNPSAPISKLWKKFYDSPNHLNDSAFSISLDNQNDFIYVTGTSSSGSTDNDYLTVKYRKNGNLIGSSAYNYISDDRAVKVVVDPYDQSVFVTGTSYGGTTKNDIVTIKYPPGFNWALNPPPQPGLVSRFDRSYFPWMNYPGLKNDETSDMTLSTDGNLYVTGSSQNMSDNSWDYTTLKV